MKKNLKFILQMIIADSSRQEKLHHATHEYYGKFIVIVIVASDEVHISLSLSFQQREVPSHYDINKFAFHLILIYMQSI